MILLKPSQIKSNKPTVKQLDDLCRTMINLRDKGTCQRCGRKKPQYKTEWAHFYSRSNKAIRWDEDNSCILCFNCHYNFAHKQPREFSEWYKGHLGDSKFSALLLRAHCTKIDRGLVKIYLEQLINKYKKEELKCHGIRP